MGYLEAFRQVLLTYGIPQEIYADRLSVFDVNNKREDNWGLEEQLAGKTLNKSQFGSILEGLGINLIIAKTPQAKGRIERLWGTLQDRLFVYFHLHKIKDVETANKSLPRFIKEYNRKFAVKPTHFESGFVPLGDMDVDKLLVVQYERTTDACSCFSFQNYKFQINTDRAIVKKKVLFLFSERIGFQDSMTSCITR